MRANRLAVFGFVVGAGAMAGAIAASVITLAVSAVFARSLVPMPVLLLGARVGTVFGGVIGPLTAFAFLRRVPIGFGLMICSVGAAVGGSVGLYVGLDSLNPYVSFAIYRSPMPQAFLGAAVGVVTAAVLARRARTRDDSSASAPANDR